jgi:hypothetical protein
MVNETVQNDGPKVNLWDFSILHIYRKILHILLFKRLKPSFHLYICIDNCFVNCIDDCFDNRIENSKEKAPQMYQIWKA